MSGARPALPWPGGCQCGAIRYEVTAEPLTLYACHCRECQRQSSSAFGLSLRLPRDGLVIDWCAPARFTRHAGAPTEVHGYFCPQCGVRLFHHRPGRDTVNLKPGTLDDPSFLVIAGNIWTDRALPFVRIDPDLLNYARQPADYDALIAAFRTPARTAAEQ